MSEQRQQDPAANGANPVVDEGLPVDLKVTNDKVWVRRLLPILVIVVGLSASGLLKLARKPPEKKKAKPNGTLVEVVRVDKKTRRVFVRGHGTVQPKRTVSIAPEVAGRVTWVNPNFVVGGLVKKGAPLVRIRAVDYKLAVEQSRAQIAQAQRSLAEAQSNAQVAKREWGLLGKRTGRKNPNPLTLGRPQLKQAQAMLASAKAAYQLARERLSRTTIRAPFNLRVRQETVEVGQFAVTGQPIGQVFGTDEAEVLVPLKVSELSWIDVPRQRFDRRGRAVHTSDGSTAWVTLKIGGKVFRRKGRLTRAVGEIDAVGRLTKVVVSLHDPYNLGGHQQNKRNQPPSAGSGSADSELASTTDFQIGSFVEVAIEGKAIPDVVTIPVHALRLGSKVWVAKGNNTLQIRKVALARLTDKEAVIKSGLTGGERVVLSAIGEPVHGMKLRILGQQQKTSKGSAKESAKGQPTIPTPRTPPANGPPKTKAPVTQVSPGRRG